MLKRIVILMIMLCCAAGANAQNSGVSFAGVTDGMLVIYSADGTPTVLEGQVSTQPFSWHSGGNQVIFVQQREEGQFIMVGDATTGSAVEVIKFAPEAGMPLTFTEDDRPLFGVIDWEHIFNENGSLTFNVLTANPGEERRKISTFEYWSGCGGTYEHLAQKLYDTETDDLIFQMTEYGLLHSKSCFGMGYGLLNLETDTETILGTDEITTENVGSALLHSGVLSPDGQTLAALRITPETQEAELYVIDLATNTERWIDTVGVPDQLAWSADSTTIFYSKRSLLNNLVDEFTEAELATLAVTDLPVYETQIRAVGLADGGDSVIFSANAYAIPRMEARGNSLFFSLIPSVENLARGVLAGTYTDMFDPDGLQLELYNYDLTVDAEPAFIGRNIERFTLAPQ